MLSNRTDPGAYSRPGQFVAILPIAATSKTPERKDRHDAQLNNYRVSKNYQDRRLTGLLVQPYPHTTLENAVTWVRPGTYLNVVI
jgi:hypothetical protein